MTVDIICHCVPSPMVFQSWLADFESTLGSQILRPEPKLNDMEWSHFGRMAIENGRIGQQARLSETWKRLFYNNRRLRSCGYRCSFSVAKGRKENVSSADFWGIEEASLSHSDDVELRVSPVLENDSAGLNLLQCFAVDHAPARLGEVLSSNPMLKVPTSFVGPCCEKWASLYRAVIYGMVRRCGFLASCSRRMGLRVKRIVVFVLGRRSTC